MMSERGAGSWGVVLALAVCAGCGWSPLASKGEYLRRGVEFARQGKYEDAALQYRKALQKDDRYGEAYLRMGQLLALRERGQEAFTALSRAVELLPESVEAREALARTAVRLLLASPQRPQVLYQAAVSSADAVLAKSPNSFEGLRTRGYLAVLDSQPEQALEYFRKAHQANPSDPEVVTMMFQSLLALNREAEAERVAREGLKAASHYGPLYDLLYARYMASRRGGDAEELLKRKIANNPKQAFFVVQLAEHYWGQKNFSAADALMRGFMDDSAGFPTAPLEAGDFYRRVGRFPEALAAYQKGLDSGREGRKEYWQRIVGIQLDQGLHGEAAGILDRVLKEYPEDAEAMASRAALRMASGRAEEMRKGVTELEGLAKKSPENERVHFTLAKAYRQIGRENDARSALQEVIRRDARNRDALREMADIAIRGQQPDEALTYAERLLAIEPSNPGARLVRTAAWALLGRMSEVKAELRQLTRDYPELPEPWIQMAALHFQERKYSEAERIYRRLYQPGQADLRALRGLAALYLGQQQASKALALVQEEARRSDSVPARSLLATTAARAGRMDLALSTLQRLTAEFPDNPELQVLIGEVHQQKGAVDQAIASFERAEKLSPQDSVPSARSGDALGQAKRYTEAVAAYRRSLAIRPESPLLMNNLAWHMALAGVQLEEALNLAQRALRKEPGNTGFADTVGMIHLKLRRLEEARAIFQGVVRRAPKTAVYRMHLASALAELGRRPEALAELKIALAHRPSESDASEIRSMMANFQ